MGRDWSPIALCHPRKDEESGLNWDPIGRWLDYADQARAMLGIAQKLHNGERTAVGDWTALGELFPMEPHGITEEVLKEWQGRPWRERPYLAMALERWLELGNVRPTFNWRHEAPAVVLEPSFFDGWTFGALAVEILMAVAKAHTLAVCSGCGAVYLREGRRPKPGQRNFCPECQGRVAPRLRKRAERARKGQQQEPTEGGSHSAAD
jgi:hypothetical protein